MTRLFTSVNDFIAHNKRAADAWRRGPGGSVEIVPGVDRDYVIDHKRRRYSVAPKREPTYPLVGLCRAAGLPEPIPEYKFHPSRKWRADYCWPKHSLILEVDGGLFVEGRHSRGVGRMADMEKLSEAAILGYRVLALSPEQLTSGVALDYLTRIFMKAAA